MKIWTQEQRGLLHSASGAEQFFESPTARAATAADQPTYLGQLAAETASLRKKLAETFPELARVQRLYG